MNSTKPEYQSLPSDEFSSLRSEYLVERRRGWRLHAVLAVAGLLAWSGLVMFFTSIVMHDSGWPEGVWSPLHGLVSYEERHFNQGLYGERSEYMGRPDAINNKAWDNLSQHGMVALTKSEASHMRDATVPWLENDQGFYIAGIEMYHQLHCLNMLRKALWDDTPFHQKTYSTAEEAGHIEHCIDYLRQVVVCHWDIGLVSFRRRGDEYLPNFNDTRMCRKHEPLQQWADVHQAGDNVPH